MTVISDKLDKAKDYINDTVEPMFVNSVTNMSITL